MNPPYRQIRAARDEESITVYQAYDPAIAEPAVTAQRFVTPFERERMTWIKPSFLWMMYRCGWATKPGRTRVLAIDLTHEGFAWALAHSCLSHPDPGPDAHARPAGAAMTRADDRHHPRLRSGADHRHARLTVSGGSGISAAGREGSS
jgi:hypothetical protein